MSVGDRKLSTSWTTSMSKMYVRKLTVLYPYTESTFGIPTTAQGKPGYSRSSTFLDKSSKMTARKMFCVTSAFKFATICVFIRFGIEAMNLLFCHLICELDHCVFECLLDHRRCVRPYPAHVVVSFEARPHADVVSVHQPLADCRNVSAGG